MTGSCTQDLSEIVETFLSEGVTAVAMESTGIYGDPLRSMLENAGIKVTVINPSLYKKPDLKTDGKDSIWLHQYHSVGLFKDPHYAKQCRKGSLAANKAVARHLAILISKIFPTIKRLRSRR